MSVTLHFAGDMSEPIRFRGVAFRDGAVLFTATLNWDGLGDFGLPQMYLSNLNVWQPEQTSLPGGSMVPLPAPLWLGSFGLLAVIALRRRLL